LADAGQRMGRGRLRHWAGWVFASLLLVGGVVLAVSSGVLELTECEYSEQVPTTCFPYESLDGSMTSTFGPRDWLLIRPESAYHRGDLVVFDGAGLGLGYDDTPGLSRVVGIGGDLVTADEQGNLSVNGRPINEGYRATDEPQWATDGFTAFTAEVPDRHALVLDDSRTTGSKPATIPISAIKGRGLAIEGDFLFSWRMPRTSAFRDAGLIEPTAREDWHRTLFIAGLFSPLPILLGAVSLITIDVRRLRRRPAPPRVA
jgi:signal peptidase I